MDEELRNRWLEREKNMGEVSDQTEESALGQRIIFLARNVNESSWSHSIKTHHVCYTRVPKKK